jgi:hypothetical protein
MAHIRVILVVIEECQCVVLSEAYFTNVFLSGHLWWYDFVGEGFVNHLDPGTVLKELFQCPEFVVEGDLFQTLLSTGSLELIQVPPVETANPVDALFLTPLDEMLRPIVVCRYG